MNVKTLFTDHPQSVGETYFEHMGVALRFSATMVGVGFCCAIHALLPFLFKTTARECVITLHDRLVTNRCRQTNSPDTGVQPIKIGQ